VRLGPASLAVLSFAALIAVGALVLALPAASADGQGVRFVDALFTSTSAVCVTGLTALPTPTAWSGLGQVTILLLVQLGGLGILTVSTLIALLLGRRVRFSQREVFSSAASPLRRVDVYRILRRIVAITIAVEAVGWALLWVAFAPQHGWGDAAWHGLFHSVSAFCNAGFSTFRDNLVGYRADVFVNAVVLALVVLGGLGFVVYMDLENRVRYGDRLGLHTKVALATSVLLVVGGGVGFWLCEARNTLAGAPPFEQAMVSVFASVVARTAGFNTVDYATVTTPCLVLTMFLMLVGGSPGSCAGGIKTTTLAVVYAAARASLTGRPSVDLFGRTVPQPAVRQAVTLGLVGLGAASVLPLGLELADDWAVPFRESATRYVEFAFETVSALGTVGLSTGVTDDLSDLQRLQVVGMMFAGRLGLLTLVLAVSRSRKVQFRYAEEDLVIG
jgi:trk system potassium uptake protein TrkH